MMKMPTTWDELFAGEETRPKSFLHDLFTPIMGAALGFGMACFVNFGTRRPVFSGLQKHLLYSGIGALGSKTISGWRDDYYAEKDAVLRHYVQLHPEDFPMPERTKFAEVLEEWVPIR